MRCGNERYIFSIDQSFEKDECSVKYLPDSRDIAAEEEDVAEADDDDDDEDELLLLLLLLPPPVDFNFNRPHQTQQE